MSEVKCWYDMVQERNAALTEVARLDSHINDLIHMMERYKHNEAVDEMFRTWVCDVRGHQVQSGNCQRCGRVVVEVSE